MPIAMQAQQTISRRLLLLLTTSSSRTYATTSTNDVNDVNDIDTNVVNYSGPLGDLISRLKMVSITGCLLSICVIPGLVFLKHGGDLPSARQATLGTIATVGAVGSTTALQFVFGSYVLTLKSIIVPITTTPFTTTDDNEDIDADDNEESSDQDNDESSESLLLVEATTRSVFGFWKNTYIFDPVRDVTTYKGARPFANFSITQNNGSTIPLYVHPDKLDQKTRQLLLHTTTSRSTDSNETTTLSGSSGVVNEGIMTKKKKNDDDEFF
ncbi:hypothetical protein FRACYDRAFT_236414 [Fragilariopsis cylindrus CCMP1102]|uniref:Transmembrane protein n=1 Tax=Fragilariopsis cylindrus CCMP1102 TaxID=635003 RepID=A0A1E7FQ96_9STRA|nr:hypothetical protein FRACYDRAFT_236414 [Fragilariopsis cylindrus CCMP1102]|eukprot:OEU20340.1 hypothetical protein FRACYDRAFT_236414 [Fragilariopsis cylindrus CCMP1102]